MGMLCLCTNTCTRCCGRNPRARVAVFSVLDCLGCAVCRSEYPEHYQLGPILRWWTLDNPNLPPDAAGFDTLARLRYNNPVRPRFFFFFFFALGLIHAACGMADLGLAPLPHFSLPLFVHVRRHLASKPCSLSVLNCLLSSRNCGHWYGARRMLAAWPVFVCNGSCGLIFLPFVAGAGQNSCSVGRGVLGVPSALEAASVKAARQPFLPHSRFSTRTFGVHVPGGG